MEKEEITMKIYSPLTADFIMDELGWEDEDGSVELAGEDLLEYAESISDALTRESARLDGGNLMAYYHAKDGVSGKVIRAVVSVEPHEGMLCSCATVQLRELLTADESTALTEYLCGQYSDGFGEGIEQREIRVDGGALFVHLWQPNGFSFEQRNAPQQENGVQVKRPKMRLAGHNGNIFAIWGRAEKLLRQNGQGEQAREMAARMRNATSYHEALGIISEYVETELTNRAPPENRPPADKSGAQRKNPQAPER